MRNGFSSAFSCSFACTVLLISSGDRAGYFALRAYRDKIASCSQCTDRPFCRAILLHRQARDYSPGESMACGSQRYGIQNGATDSGAMAP